MSARLLLVAALLVFALPLTASSQSEGAVARPVPPPMPMTDVEIDDAARMMDMDMAMANVDLSGPPDVQGTLDDQDPTSPERSAPMDTYSFSVRAGDEVTVTMSSQTFDTYLIVRGPGGGEWMNDDFGSTRVSQVQFNAAAGGTYTIIATAFSDSGRGDYEVRTRSARPTVLSSVEGRLDYQDTQLVKGEYVDVLAVRSPQRGPFFVELRPLGFSGYLRVTSPGGVQTRGTAGYDARAIRVGPLDSEAGQWTVDVTSAGEGAQVGAYDLVVFTLDDQ